MTQACPQCNSNAFKRNGYTRHGKQNHRCLNCGRQFSLPGTLESELSHHSFKLLDRVMKEGQAAEGCC